MKTPCQALLLNLFLLLTLAGCAGVSSLPSAEPTGVPAAFQPTLTQPIDIESIQDTAYPGPPSPFPSSPMPTLPGEPYPAPGSPAPSPVAPPVTPGAPAPTATPSALTPTITPAVPVPPTQTATPETTPTAVLTPTPAELLLPQTPLPEDLPIINQENAAQTAAFAEWREADVTSLTWAPDSVTLAVGSLASIQIYEMPSRSQVRTLEPRGEGVLSLAFSPDGRYLAAGSRLGSPEEGFAGSIQLWYGEDLRPLGVVFSDPRAVTSVAFSPNSPLFAASLTGPEFGDDSLAIWNTNTWEITSTLRTENVLRVGFSSTGELMASSPDRYAIKVWTMRNAQLVDNLYTSFTGAVNSLAFAPGGNLLATGHYDGTLRLWDVSSGSLLNVFETEGVVESLAFSPDGRLLASGDSYADHALRIWSMESGELLQTLPGHPAGVVALAFSPDGRLLASGSYDGVVRLSGVRAPGGAP